MSGKTRLADLLQELHVQKKSGALYAAVVGPSENLVRFYFREGEIYHLCYGPIKDRECLDILGCYDLSKNIFFDGFKAPRGISGSLPKTAEIIALVREMN